jgi:hypothetical protein
MQAKRYAYESVDMEAIDQAECEENGIINNGIYVRSQIIQKPKLLKKDLNLNLE